MSKPDSIDLDGLIIQLFRRTVQGADALFMQHVGNVGLTPRQFAVLLTVEQQSGVNQTQLVEQTGIDRSTLSDIVRRLVRQGLLQRRRSKEDSRAYAIRLSDKGRQSLQAAEPCSKSADTYIQSLLPPQQRQDVLMGLKLLADALNRRPYEAQR